MPLGTAGEISTSRTGRGWVARCRVRDLDGRIRQVERAAVTKTAAVSALKAAVTDRNRGAKDEAISSASKVSVLAELWFRGLRRKSPNTMHVYRDRLDRQVIPSLGELRVRELSVGTVSRHLRSVELAYGSAVARLTRSVLSGMCALAAQHDALDHNPVRDAGRFESTPKKKP
jgi:hypothetical protein